MQGDTKKVWSDDENETTEHLVLNGVSYAEHLAQEAVEMAYPDLTEQEKYALEDAFDPQGLGDAVYIAMAEDEPRTWPEQAEAFAYAQGKNVAYFVQGDPTDYSKPLTERSTAVGKLVHDIMLAYLLNVAGPDTHEYVRTKNGVPVES